jgi:hypothetical protein
MILIVGDSWSLGEWKKMSISHCGFAQYLSDAGHLVCNIGTGGGWNGLSVSRLDSFLQSNTFSLDKITHIFVFQTEWIRDEVNSFSTLSVEQDHHYNYQTLKDRIMSRFYHNLSHIGKTVGKKIFLIGGVSDTIWLDKFSQEYPNLEIVCQSFTNLIVNQNHRVEEPVFCLYNRGHVEIVEKFKKLYANKDFNLVLDDIDLGSNRVKTFNANRDLFWPDGKHPNQHGHRILFDFLQQKGIV